MIQDQVIGRFGATEALKGDARTTGGAMVTSAAIAALAGLPLLWLLVGPMRNEALYVPTQHFLIVTGVALLALVLSGVLAIATVQIGLYRVLFLTLGFMTMAGFFAVHGLATPGILVPDYGVRYQGSVLGFSAFLSLFLPALLFTASYLPSMERLERRLPFWPAGWLVAVAGVGIAAYGAFALGSSDALAELPLTRPPATWAIAAVSAALLLRVAVIQGLRSRTASEAGLAQSFLLLAVAQLTMVFAAPWSFGWWGYHLAMLAAVGIALRSLAIERIRGRSLRTVLEGTLKLEVKVGVELENVGTIAALASAVELKDRETQGHNVRVAELAVAIGRELGLDSGRLRILARAGLLHDVGKLGVPDAILHKRGPLDDAEWAIVKTHPLLGVQILSKVGNLRRESQAVLHHHERVDGKGYPAGLKADAIPLEARIVAVADTYDVLISDRPYRKGRTPSEAQEVVKAEAGTQLDQPAVAALLRAVGAAPGQLGATPDQRRAADPTQSRQPTAIRL